MTRSRSSPLPRDLFLLKPGIAFLNHGSFGACPRRVFEKYQAWQRELESQPVEFLSHTRRFRGLMADARAALSEFTGTQPDNLAFYPNATSALNVVIRSLEFEPGDEVLTTDHEYGALDRTWRFHGRKNASRMQQRQQHAQEFVPVYHAHKIPLPVTTHGDLVERFFRSVTKRTRVIYFSHITSPTALILPVREICRRAREHNILTIVDGAHSIGQVPLSLEDLECHFYSSNCHKWLCAPKGSAFLYAHPSVQHLVDPLVVSWGYEPETPGRPRFIEEHEWLGTRDISAYLTVSEAIKFQQDHDWHSIRQQCHELAVKTRQQIVDLTGLPAISPESTGQSPWFAQMFAAELPPIKPEELKERLYDEFGVEVPIITWNDRHYIRVSIQAYNSEDDTQRLLDALRQLLPQVGNATTAGADTAAANPRGYALPDSEPGK